MKRFLLLGAAMLLVSCDSDQPASANNLSGDSGADTNTSESSRSAASMSLLDTTWEFDDDGKPTVITIDKLGAYIENRTDGMHVDHGTYVQKAGKDCFTSAMGDQGTSCWTAVPQTEIGDTASATADSGQTAVFRRVDYRTLKIAG